jgi:tetratricopeptide (TPR) repeat protein
MPKTLSICLFLLLSGAAVLAAPATPAVIAEVQAALDKGDAREAQRLADGALAGAGDGERAQLLLSRGMAHELMGSHDAALADFTAAINSHALPRDDRAQALLQRGFLYDGLGRLDPAMLDYGAVIALKTPLMGSALNNRANIWRRQGRLTEARRDYLAALKSGGVRQQYPYYGLGQIAEAQHDKDAARGFYARSVAADSSYRLASERLEELGGPPEGTLTDPDIVHLKPPAKEPGAFSKPPAGTGRIVLKPPPRRAAGGPPKPVGLRPALDAEAGRGPEVQLGAWRSQAEAEAGWAKAVSRSGGALDGLSRHIVRADLPGQGTYYRLRTAAPEPDRLCERLHAAGIDCLRARD